MTKCKEEMQIFQRCVGYYSSRHTVNKGKLEEIKSRKTYNINKSLGLDVDKEVSSMISKLTSEGER